MLVWRGLARWSSAVAGTHGFSGSQGFTLMMLYLVSACITGSSFTSSFSASASFLAAPCQPHTGSPLHMGTLVLTHLCIPHAHPLLRLRPLIERYPACKDTKRAHRSLANDLQSLRLHRLRFGSSVLRSLDLRLRVGLCKWLQQRTTSQVVQRRLQMRLARNYAKATGSRRKQRMQQKVRLTVIT